jgi:DNA transformation protein and related proteins
MAVSAETRAWVLELFGELGEVSARAMMGGLSLYAGGTIFAIVGPEDRIFLKASGPLAAALSEAGAEQFSYTRNGRVARMGYWSLPDAAVDDPDAACRWARRSLAMTTGGAGFS